MADMHTELARALSRTNGDPMPTAPWPTFQPRSLWLIPEPDCWGCQQVDTSAEQTPLYVQTVRAFAHDNRCPELRALAGALGVETGGKKGEISDRIEAL